MKPPITLSDLKKTACWKNNLHLEEAKPVKRNQKEAGRKSEAIRYLNKNLWLWCRENNLELTTEYEFAEGRKYRSDYAIVGHRLLIEYEGGVFMDKAGHNTAAGIQRDISKYELAHKLGFTVIRLTAINYKSILQKLDEILET